MHRIFDRFMQSVDARALAIGSGAYVAAEILGA